MADFIPMKFRTGALSRITVDKTPLLKGEPGFITEGPGKYLLVVGTGDAGAPYTPIGGIEVGAIADRRTAGIPGTFFAASDEKGLYLDTGTEWVSLGKGTMTADTFSVPESAKDGSILQVKWETDATTGAVTRKLVYAESLDLGVL